MRRFTAVICAVGGMFSAAFASADPAATATDEQQLAALEQEWGKAAGAHDAATLARILDDQFVGTFGTGKLLDKKAFITAMTDGPVDATISQTLTDQTIVVAGDTAILVETDTVRRIKNGQPVENVYRFTTTYIRRDGRWLALAEQTAKFPPAK